MKGLQFFSEKLQMPLTIMPNQPQAVLAGVNMMWSRGTYWSNDDDWSKGTYWTDSRDWNRGTYWTDSRDWNRGTYWTDSRPWNRGTYWSNDSSSSSK